MEEARLTPGQTVAAYIFSARCFVYGIAGVVYLSRHLCWRQ